MSAALSRLLTLREQLLLVGFAAAILIGAGALYFGRDDLGPGGETIAVDRPTAAVIAPPPPPPRTEATAAPAEAPATEFVDGYVTPAQAQPTVTRIGVAIRGEVTRPDLYYFSPGDRVDDLITEAGGLTPTADVYDINIGAHLIDGTTLTIPALAVPAFDGHALRARNTEPDPVLNPPEYTISGWRGSGTVQGQAGAGGTSAGVPTAAGARVNLNTATQADLESLPGIGPAYASRILAYRAKQPFERIEDLMFISGIAEKRFAALKDLVTVR